ncbi:MULTISPECIES: type II toxin-antitoxin system VapC family toxin [unclassified Coleofasciculus]|uniref:type II toxin-antitoxin system VapC family toxin n=1 Tax=unclassified Coleofasciculus TaxID=2692782 RepID=UPI00187FB903|nr:MULTISPECIES: type II toxin-antitoxin system VapC family toxin [unclassified Coleofasciculus]MBE9125372.1 type II toxin-antitoxin system VapC family toxin [Coleofasciculus sp. LEGE 07081]MBE9147411.1 type II toxin-antitoxin system VapC family toxin [Coleofasciculus sp. LEGE 07092]
MTRYILDTDHVTLLQQVHPIVTQRISAVNCDDVGVTVVTVEEQVRGWLSAIRKTSQSSQPERLIWAYRGLRDVVKYLSRLNLIDFSEEAYAHYQELRRQRIRIGTQDLRIAAIVLAENSILVTRNQRDFVQVPGLVFEDWTVHN